MSYEDNLPVRPAVIVVDKSESMKPVIGSVTTRVNDLIERLTADPAQAEALVLGALEFDIEVRTRLPLLRFESAYTHLYFDTEGRRTDFARALDACRHMLSVDLRVLAKYGYRPVVFFISDGGHNVGSFDEARRNLLGLALPPKIAVFEISTEASNTNVLKGLATDSRLYVPVDASDEAIGSIMLSIFGTLGGYGTGGGDDVAAGYWDGEIDDDGSQRIYPIE